MFTKHFGVVGVRPSGVASGVAGLPFLHHAEADFDPVRSEVRWQSMIGEWWTGENPSRVPVGRERSGGSDDDADVLLGQLMRKLPSSATSYSAPRQNMTSTHHPRLVCAEKSDLHVGRDVPLESHKGGDDVGLGYLNDQSQFPLGDLFHSFGDLVLVVKLAQKETTDEGNLGRRGGFTSFKVEVQSRRGVDDGVRCERVFGRGRECE